MRSFAVRPAALLPVSALLVACSSSPAPTRTGFLSDYSRLETVDKERARYISPDLKRYSQFIVDPVEWRAQQSDLSGEDRAKIANHFHDSLVRVLQTNGFAITDAPAANAARIRVAITNIHDATWWMKVHPGSSLAGAGRGGAACEGEIIDSVSGEQLAAFVRAGVGSQFTVGNFSTVSDVNNVIDQWAKDAAKRLDELRNQY
jgi:hypothetical protein